MKFALVTETYPPEVNGVAMTNQRLVRGLVERGCEILLIKPRHRDARPHEDPARVFEVFGLPIPNYAGLKMGLPAPGQMEQLLEREAPDLVHVATEGPLGLSALRAANRLGLPVSSTFHTNFHDYCGRYGAGFLEHAMLAYLRWFHNGCALTTVPDPDLIRQLSGAGIKRLVHLGRGADVRRFDPAHRDHALRAKWGAAADDPVALFVGRAAAEKDIPLSLEAYRAAKEKNPRLQMVVVGDGPVRERLERSYPEVHFAGMRYDADLARHYASADLFLFASPSETFGNVTVEALASGLAVLTYDYAAGRQFIKHGENGWLVPPGDREAFVAAARALVEAPELWSTARQRARETAERYPWQASIDRFYQLLGAVAHGDCRTAGSNSPSWANRARVPTETAAPS